MSAETQPPWLLAVELPYPPSVNHLWRHVGAAVLKSAAGRAYDARCRQLVWAATRQPDTWRPTGRLCVVVDVRPPDRRARDLDNVLKALQDGLCAGLEVDDATIDEVHLYRREPQPGGSVFVVVRPAGREGGGGR